MEIPRMSDGRWVKLVMLLLTPLWGVLLRNLGLHTSPNKYHTDNELGNNGGIGGSI